ncbi:hypothetical protein CC78DRAFT_581048 [Lojkania enalia]|uniref:Uncharacterized protein n=1 Tax=Lojkania enalia TaxID=147567 RepID=A0A9P4K9W3_9PLEO|nr:hypothetical protein CC78DRAFT_581048 [Didymosphaeria enalia]
MPPKKKTAASTGSDEAGDKSFRWTAEYDLKLLYLLSIPRTIGAKEHVEIAVTIPGATPGGVRNRAWKIKVDHKRAYEEAGISMPGGSSVSRVASKSEAHDASSPGKKPPTAGGRGKKRSAKDLDTAEDNDGENIFKKPKTNINAEQSSADISIKEEDADENPF